MTVGHTLAGGGIVRGVRWTGIREVLLWSLSMDRSRRVRHTAFLDLRQQAVPRICTKKSNSVYR